jgi:hypothetical protein
VKVRGPRATAQGVRRLIGRVWAGRRVDRRHGAGRLVPLLLLAPLVVVGCTGSRRTPVGEVRPPVPEIARRTVSAYVQFGDIRMVPVSGFGLVIGLSGTGSREMPPTLREKILREMGRAGLENPRELLESPNNAAVLVTGMVMPYHSRGSRFDVQVSALEGTQTSSLEGGTLMKTYLTPAFLDVQGQTLPSAALAVAHGPVVLADAPATQPANPTWKRQGRVIGGGRFSGQRKVTLELTEPNWRMCVLIEQAINQRFPRAAMRKSRRVFRPQDYQGPRPGAEPIAGLDVEPPSRETDFYVELTVPEEYAGRWTHFLQVVANLYLDQTEEGLTGRVEYLVKKLRSPEERLPAAYGLEAVGRLSRDPLAALLGDPDPDVRALAAFVLADLGDPRATPAVLDLARQPGPYRLAAIDALGQINAVQVIQALQELCAGLDDESRYAAYRSLRRIPGQTVVEHLDAVSSFGVDVVQSSGPPLLMAEAEGDPRLIFFGSGIRFRPPFLWDEGRYWAMAKEEDQDLIVMNPMPAPRRPLLQGDLVVAKMDVLQYVIVMDQLRSNYPAVLRRLSEADRLGRLSARFVLRKAAEAADAPVLRRWD